MHKRIYISIPISPSTRIEPKLVHWLIKNITKYNFMHPEKELIVSYDLVEGKPIDSVRNNAINRFLKTDNDYILTIDSDIVPPDNCIEELLKWNKDIVGAACFTFQYGYPFAVILDKVNGGYSRIMEFNGRLQKCAATGAACVLIKREVIEKMKNHLLETTGKTMYYETKYNEKGELSWGQDFMFCENAIQSGYEIYVDTGLLCGHFVDRLDLKRVNDILIKEQLKVQKAQEELKQSLLQIKQSENKNLTMV